jgi:hypothetical protein
LPQREATVYRCAGNGKDCVMTGLLEGLIEQQYVPIVSWILIAAIALIALYVVLRLIRMLTSGTFIAGGRNRRTRLAVMDATAVDDKRRLVLVRRDDVEHLILIGGPTDVVVEQDIRMIARSSRPPNEPDTGHDMGEAADEAPPRPMLPPQPRPAPRDFRTLERTPVMRAPASARPAVGPAAPSSPPPAAPPPQPAPPVAPARAAPAPVAPPPRPAAPPVASSAPPAPPAAPPRPAAPPVDLRRDPPVEARRQPAPELRREPPPPASASAYATRPAASAQMPRPPVRAQTADASAASALDDALLHELEASLRPTEPSRPAVADPDLDDEMAKLLGDLSRDRR